MSNRIPQPPHPPLPSGPFETERQATEYARSVARPEVWAESLTEANRAVLSSAFGATGVELGAFDRRIRDWLADWEPATVAVIAAAVFRAYFSALPTVTAGPITLKPEQLETVLVALDEAEELHMRECPDCDAVGTADEPACPRHMADEAQIERYSALAALLHGQVAP
jgi:hypothetical protein